MMPLSRSSTFCSFSSALGLSLAVVVAGGCNPSGSATLTESPKNWAEFENKTVTLEGTAGNSRLGPIVRLAGGEKIFVSTRPWPIDVVSRPVGVKGKLVRGTGAQEDQYVLAADSWWLQKSTNVPRPVK
jgi:hypothetical protein